MKLALALVAIAAVFAIAAPASAKKAARCVIASAGNPDYRGPCAFLPDKGGSFGLEAIGKRGFSPDIVSISVWIVEPGVAEVRGLTRDGINSRWGEARRSKRDRACWDGADFRICVY
jgi:hypothetical protein